MLEPAGIGRRSRIVIFCFAGLFVVPVLAYVYAAFLGLIAAAILTVIGHVSEVTGDIISFVVIVLSYFLAAWLYWWLWKQFKRTCFRGADDTKSAS